MKKVRAKQLFDAKTKFPELFVTFPKTEIHNHKLVSLGMDLRIDEFDEIPEENVNDFVKREIIHELAESIVKNKLYKLKEADTFYGRAYQIIVAVEDPNVKPQIILKKENDYREIIKAGSMGYDCKRYGKRKRR